MGVATGQNGAKDLVLSRNIISTGVHVNNLLVQTISLLLQTVDPVMHLHALFAGIYVGM